MHASSSSSFTLEVFWRVRHFVYNGSGRCMMANFCRAIQVYVVLMLLLLYECVCKRATFLLLLHHHVSYSIQQIPRRNTMTTTFTWTFSLFATCMQVPEIFQLPRRPQIPRQNARLVANTKAVIRDWHVHSRTLYYRHYFVYLYALKADIVWWCTFGGNGLNN